MSEHNCKPEESGEWRLDKQATGCPKCGGRTYCGYGLAGGGIGTYTMCLHCDWFDKTQDTGC